MKIKVNDKVYEVKDSDEEVLLQDGKIYISNSKNTNKKE